MHTYLICGYGIPEDIRTDTNYQTYLNIAFNHVYQQSRNKQATLIPCGGPTSCEPPYTGTEAAVIATYLQERCEQAGTEATSGWKIIPETTSLSTLENLLHTKQLMDAHALSGELTIICEFTRKERVRRLAEAIFTTCTVHVDAIDFDSSSNRYLDPEVIQEKEALGIKEGLWTLEEPERIAVHHELFERKFEFIRQRQSEGLSHVEAVEEWFRGSNDRLRELMPDHPLINN